MSYFHLILIRYYTDGRQVGQAPYYSQVSDRKEYRPIVATIIGAKGSDLMLLELARKALEKARWPASVKTGPLMFDIASNVRKTARTAEKD